MAEREASAGVAQCCRELGGGRGPSQGPGRDLHGSRSPLVARMSLWPPSVWTPAPGECGVPAARHEVAREQVEPSGGASARELPGVPGPCRAGPHLRRPLLEEAAAAGGLARWAVRAAGPGRPVEWLLAPAPGLPCAPRPLWLGSQLHVCTLAMHTRVQTPTSPEPQGSPREPGRALGVVWLSITTGEALLDFRVVFFR